MPITKDTHQKVCAQEYEYLKNTYHVTVLHIKAIAADLLELHIYCKYIHIRDIRNKKIHK